MLVLQVATVAGSVVGSAAIAALLSNAWQKKKYQAESLHSGLSEILDVYGRVNTAAWTVAGVYGLTAGKHLLTPDQAGAYEAAVLSLRKEYSAIEGKLLLLTTVDPELMEPAAMVKRGIESIVGGRQFVGLRKESDGRYSVVLDGHEIDLLLKELDRKGHEGHIALCELVDAVAARRKIALSWNTWDRFLTQLKDPPP